MRGALQRTQEMSGLLGPGVDYEVIEVERGWWPLIQVSKPITEEMSLADIIRFYVDNLSLLINENVLGVIELMSLEKSTANGEE